MSNNMKSVPNPCLRHNDGNIANTIRTLKLTSLVLNDEFNVN